MFQVIIDSVARRLPGRLSIVAAAFALALASELGAAQFNLSWADNSSNEAGFQIERATGSSGSFSLIATTAANVTSYVDTGLPASTLYRYRLRAYNSAGYSAYSNTASGTTPAASANTAPTLTTIGNQTIPEDGQTSAISFTIGDAQTAASSLTVSGTSSNTTLVPNASITFGGSGANRTVTVRPAANQFGTTTITVRVSDGSLTTSRSFTLTVTSVNDAPTISSIANRTVQSGMSSGSIGFTVGDVETAAGSLAVTATSSNSTVLPNSRLTLGGSGANRTLTFTPQSGTSGTSTVTVSVSDGSLSTSTSFVVTVTNPASAPTNTAPTISTIASQTIAANGTSSALAFTIGDAQTSAGSLTLSAASSNTSLIPAANITFGGSGANRTVTVRSTSSATGSSTIAITVSDGSLTTSTSFVATVASTAVTSGDVGSPAISGSTSTSGSTIQIRAGGTDIWSTSDQFHFSRQSITGDAELKVRVTGLTNSNAWAKAGLMFRTSTNANAAYVFVCLTPSNGIALQYRSTAGAAAVHQSATSAAVPNWLRLTRSGNTFHAASSTNGSTWVQVGSVVVNLPGSTLAGLAVTSHAANVATTATFESLTTVVAPATTPPPATTPSNTAPTISSIATRTVAMNTTSSAIAFTIGDAQTAASSLTLSAASSNAALIPTGNITFGGSGANRTLTVRPVVNSTGSSTITVTVSDGSLATSTSFLVNVTASLASGDIGSPAISGSLTVSGATMQIRAGGTDIWGTSDQFHFARQSITGDTELTVRVSGLTNSNSWAKAGLMLRSSTAANSAFVHVFLTPSNGVVLQYRSTNGAYASQKYRESATAPRWLKLTRTGNTFYAFQSTNGTTWSLLDFVTVNLPNTALAGLAVTSHNAGSATTATFENFSVD